MTTLLLSQADVSSLLSMEAAIRAVEGAFAAHGRGETQMPPKVYLDFPEHSGDLRAMPSAMSGSAGLKWVNSHPENPQRHGLPSVMALYVLSDPATALPLAVMDGTVLTAYRTGAAAGVASRHLARSDARTLGIVGCGVQSDFLVDAHRVVFGDIEVLAADRNAEAASRLAAKYGGRSASVEEASACDIVCTATPSRTPVVQRGWLRPGVHLNAMGADAEGKQELDPQILIDARVFVDDVAQATHSGEVNVPLHQGDLAEASLAGTLGEVITGRHLGRESSLVTVFDSTGLALQDLALATILFEAAKRDGVGTWFDFGGQASS